MKFWLGLIMMILGVLLGLYIGVWVMFIGGIVGLIEIVKTQNWDSMLIAINIAKIIFAGVAGYTSALLLIIPGKILTDNN